MNSIYCSTGALGYYPVNPDADLMRTLFPQLEADGYEVIIDRAVPDHAEQWSRMLRQDGIPVGMVHIGKQTGESFASDDNDMHAAGLEKLKADLSVVQLFGARQAVLHLWGWPGNDRYFEKTIESLDQALRLAAEAGIELLVETIPCVEQPMADRLHELARLFPKLRFTLDSRLLALRADTDAVLSADWVWEENRVAHIHISDCGHDEEGVLAQRPILQPGDGVLDFDSFFHVLRQRAYSGAVTLEAPAVHPVSRAVDVARLNRSLAYIRTSLEPHA